MTDYHPREITPFLARVLKQTPVLVIGGLRQTGKSTLLQHEAALARGRTYRTLDDLGLLEQARLSPETFLDSAPKLAVDEAQRLPELPMAVKRAVDQDRRAGRFVLSGSANLLALEKVTESLAGRAYYATLHPLNRREIHRGTATAPVLAQFLETGRWPACAAPPITEAEILRGGFPEVALEPEFDAAVWFAGYERTCLERDVRDVRQVEDLVAFRRLLRLLVLRVGSVLNAASFGRDAQLPRTTVTRHLDTLEAMYLTRPLPPFLGNRSSRLIKAPKLYLADSGLAAHLAGVTDIAASSAEPLRGALIENYALQNLVATLEPHLTGVRFHYWHEQGRHEVDFVLEHGRKVVGIEVKAASRWSGSDLRGLEAFRDRTPNCVAVILANLGTEVVSLGEKRWVVPLHVLLA